MCSFQVPGNCAEDAGCSDGEEGWGFSSTPAGLLSAVDLPTLSQQAIKPIAEGFWIPQPGEIRLHPPSAAFLSSKS